MVAILEHMTALSDPVRCRMLMLLEKQELTVSELCSVLQMPQSSVSRQLKTLADDNWVVSRRDGTSRFYAMSTGDDLDPGAKRLWPLIREQVAATSAAGQDDRRLRGVLARRRAKSQEFFASAAGDWDRLRSDLFGDTFFLVRDVKKAEAVLREALEINRQVFGSWSIQAASSLNLLAVTIALDQRRIADDSGLAVDLADQLRERPS